MLRNERENHRSTVMKKKKNANFQKKKKKKNREKEKEERNSQFAGEDVFR